MNKKLILRYILMYIPFSLGVILFSSGTINLFSSLLLFVGGYVAIKNTFDYRKIRKNVKSINQVNRNNINNKVNSSSYKKDYSRVKNPEHIIGFKRNIRHPKVRKRTKY